VIVSTLLDAGWGSGAYQVGIFSFLVLLLIGVWLLRGVPEPAANAWDAEAEAAWPASAVERLDPGATAIEPAELE
jgi:hypothetical protein